MKKYLFLALVLMGFVSCEKVNVDPLMDVPYINFYDDVATAEAAGAEEFIIPVESTGINAVTISNEDSVLDYWSEESKTGSNAVDGSWIEIVEVIEFYDSQTRALIGFDSAIVVRIKANDTGMERKVTLSANSFTKSDTITITQLAE